MGDAPFYNVKEGDLLGYDDFIDPLVDIIISSEDSTPFTVGIQGDWGVGKTTVMRRIQGKLEDKRYMTIWFNPWKYTEKEDVWKGLIRVVFDKIPHNLFRKIIVKWKDIAVIGGDRFLGRFGMGGAISEIKDTLNLDPRFINEFENIMEDLVRELLDNYKDKKRKKNKEKDNKDNRNLLIIFIDDLDRCRPECSIRILEAIKLYLCVPQCVFVIGFNINIIEKGIKAVYGKDLEVDGSKYMEKIIQLPFRVPRPGKEEIKKYTETCIRNIDAVDIFGEEGKINSEYIDIIIQGADSNPRKIKRFLNSFVLLHDVKKKRFEKEKGEKGEKIYEFRHKKLIYLLLVQLRWNNLFRLIDKNRHLMIKLQKYISGEEVEQVNELNQFLDKKNFLDFTRDNNPEFEDEDELDMYLEHSRISRFDMKEPESLKLPLEIEEKIDAYHFEKQGSSYEERGNLEEALVNFEAALKAYRYLGDMQSEARILENIGDIHRKRENIEKALRYFNEALMINKEIGNRQRETNLFRKIEAVRGEVERSGRDFESQEIKRLPGWKVPLTIWWDEKKKAVKLIDQTLLPSELKIIECKDCKCIEEAISLLRIRGASPLGAAGAYALAVEAQRFKGDEEGFFEKMKEARSIVLVRPSTVNLDWAVQRVYNALLENRGKGMEKLKEIALKEAEIIVKEDIEINRKIGGFGLELFKKRMPNNGKEFRILTHSHAGSLATCGYGTVFGVIRAAFMQGTNLHVYVNETRPLLQGARIVAWELKLEGIPVTLIPDNAAGWVMEKDGIDMVIVGAYRIVANGDTANSIGTYSLSILAKEHGIPFYVAAPLHKIDLTMKTGDEIMIEKRDYREVTHVRNVDVASFLNRNEVINYAFDMTPNKNITGIITEAGIIRESYRKNLKRILERTGSS